MSLETLSLKHKHSLVLMVKLSKNEDIKLNTVSSSPLISQDAFVELYGESRPPVSFWSLRTLFGLAVLGAAGITLGALFTWR